MFGIGHTTHHVSVPSITSSVYFQNKCLGQSGVNEISSDSKRQQEDSNPGLLEWKSDVLPSVLLHHT